MFMAIGMNKLWVFFMIVFEIILLGIVVILIGFLLGYLIINYVRENGINMLVYSEGMVSYGLF